MTADDCSKITPRDLSVLEDMLERFRGDDMLTRAIRQKLRFARITFAEDLPPNVVSLGSRVAFQVDRGPVKERILVTADQYRADQSHQSVASLRGVAMMGLSEGTAVDVELDDRSERLSVMKVLYQPEADRLSRGAPSGLRLVSDRGADGPAAQVQHQSAPSDDDPEPPAA